MLHDHSVVRLGLQLMNLWINYSFPLKLVSLRQENLMRREGGGGWKCSMIFICLDVSTAPDGVNLIPNTLISHYDNYTYVITVWRLITSHMEGEGGLLYLTTSSWIINTTHFLATNNIIICSLCWPYFEEIRNMCVLFRC